MPEKKNLALLILLALFSAIAIYTLSPRAYYSEKNPILDEIRERFRMIKPEYAKIPLRTGKSSYTDYKTLITLCLINPKTQKYYNINVIMYVALHELAHVITKDKEGDDHGPIYKKNFAELLDIAKEKGVYDARVTIPETYCGIK